jgi:hypothetical protein
MFELILSKFLMLKRSFFFLFKGQIASKQILQMIPANIATSFSGKLSLAKGDSFPEAHGY